MLQVFAIASNALLVQGRKLEEIAAAVTATGPAADPVVPADGPSQVRIGALPLGGAIEPMVSLRSVALAYEMTASVTATADDMLDALLDAVHSDDT
jgi:hypothetical protein